MNGHVSKLKRSTEILPGSEIVVPKRTKAKTTLADVVGSISSIAGLASTLATTAYNITK